ncbi:MAG: hypothetical protein ANABAC_1232 [Anaerolineae bacterium]|nr:MAG: hypothetical protein ANABAC_1232 [Anaerolineae bacterium]
MNEEKKHPSGKILFWFWIRQLFQPLSRERRGEVLVHLRQSSHRISVISS